MSNLSFMEKETKCRNAFASLPQMYMLCTPEDHPILFSCDNDYGEAITLLGICAKLFPGIRIITFELMSNHVHIVLCGDKAEIEMMFALFRKKLQKQIEAHGYYIDMKGFVMRLFPIDDLEYARNAIVYTNRNAFIVLDDVTPFSYEWGAGSYYFNPKYTRLYNLLKKPMSVVERRTLFHGRESDNASGLYRDGKNVSPISFCDIAIGESLFRDAKHYFNKISKNVESYEAIAKTIGESIYYTDDDLFMVMRTCSKEQYGEGNMTLLPWKAKLELARKMHFDYHATDKQIKRFLKLDDNVIASLF